MLNLKIQFYSFFLNKLENQKCKVSGVNLLKRILALVAVILAII